MTAGPSTRTARFETIAHYLTALVIILKGADKIGTPGKTAFAVVLVVIGIFIVLGTLLHHRLASVLKHFKAYVFVLEFIVMGIVGYLYMKEGKQYLPYVCFAACLMFLVAAVIYVRKLKIVPR